MYSRSALKRFETVLALSSELQNPSGRVCLMAKSKESASELIGETARHLNATLGISIAVNAAVPAGEVWFVDSEGNDVGRIVGISVPETPPEAAK